MNYQIVPENIVPKTDIPGIRFVHINFIMR